MKSAPAAELVSDSHLDSSILDEQRAWQSRESLDYYRRHRRSVQELYPSERFFLPEVLRQVDSMLDVGCAAGGFSAVAHALNAAIRYVGVDVVPAFIEAARNDYPEAEFLIGDGVHFTTPPESYDLAHSSGVLHLNLRYRDIIDAMWRQTSRFLLCDLRLTTGPAEVGRLESPFGEEPVVSVPYIVLTVEEAVALFTDLDPRPSSLRVRGYPQRASEAARLTNPDVVTAFFLAEKGGGDPEPRVDIDLNAR